LAQKQSTRRQLVEDARQTALTGNWEEAVTLNQQIIDRFQTDAEAFNRLGRAFASWFDMSYFIEDFRRADHRRQRALSVAATAG